MLGCRSARISFRIPNCPSSRLAASWSGSGGIRTGGEPGGEACAANAWKVELPDPARHIPHPSMAAASRDAGRTTLICPAGVATGERGAGRRQEHPVVGPQRPAVVTSACVSRTARSSATEPSSKGI
jgi:hypothetical protein